MEHPKSVKELADAQGVKVYDTALPQPWVDKMRDVYHHDVRGHFVWSYDGAGVFGRPHALTPEGGEMLLEEEAGA